MINARAFEVFDLNGSHKAILFSMYICLSLVRASEMFDVNRSQKVPFASSPKMNIAELIEM